MDRGDRQSGKVAPTSRCRAVACALGVLVLQSGGAMSADTIGGKPDAAYLSAISGLRLQAEIVYLPPNAPLDLATKPADEPPKPAAPPSGTDLRDVEIARWVIIGIAAAVLAFIALVVIRNSAGGKAIFAKPPGTETRPRQAAAASPADGPLPPGMRLLAELASLPDRREALQLLTEHALDRATRQNGIRLGRSQTARDVLRFLPAGWRHRAALNLVVRTEEVVRFGGEPLAESTFADCLASIRPLFADHAAA